jgi:hypothetical protein
MRPEQVEKVLAADGWKLAKQLHQPCVYNDCEAYWPVSGTERLQRCPVCRRWQVPLWKRELPGWLKIVFYAMAGPTIAFLTVTILKLYYFPRLF